MARQNKCSSSSSSSSSSLGYVFQTPLDNCNGRTVGFVMKETKYIPESLFQETTAEVRRSTGLRTTALGDRPTNNPLRRLQRPITEVSQLTTRRDDFSD